MKIKNIKIISLMLIMIVLQTGCINKDENFADNSKFTLDENLNQTTTVKKTTETKSTTIQAVSTSTSNLSTNTKRCTSSTTTNTARMTNTSVISSKLLKYKSIYNTEISSEIINPDVFTTAINTINITSDISKFTLNENNNEIQTKTSTTTVPITTTESSITESEKILLCNLVGREYGSDYHGSTGVPVTLYERGQVVAVVMNRVASDKFPDNIYDVITQPNQFSGYLPSDVYSYQVTQNVIDSVDYYFQHTNDYSSEILYFEGDGSYNYFH